MDQPRYPVFFALGKLSEELSEVVSSKGITVVDRDSFNETANDVTFNESKYYGTVCFLLSQGVPLMITDAQEMLSKKKELSLPYHVMTRLGVKKGYYRFILVENVQPVTTWKMDPLREWMAKNAEIMTAEEFGKYDLTVEKPPVIQGIKVTCGLLSSHMQDGKEVTGHITRGYGLSVDDSDMAHENNGPNIGKTCKGEIIELTANGKPGGSIVMINELGDLSHVTNNTTIRSALSGPVLGKHMNSISEFTLKDIDPNAKQDLNLKVAKIGDTDVQIIGWYTYAINLN